MCDLRNIFQKAFCLKKKTVIRGNGFNDDGSDFFRVFLKYRTNCRDVIQRDNNSIRSDRSTYACAIRRSHFSKTRTCANEHRIHMAMITAIKFQNLVSSSRSTRQSKGRHDRFGSRIYETNFLHPRKLTRNELRKLQRIRLRRTIGPTARKSAFDSTHDLWITMAEKKRTP